VIKKYEDCVNNFCVNEDNETPGMSFEKVISNDYYDTVGFKSMKILIFISRRFSVTVFCSYGEFRNNRRLIINQVAEDSKRKSNLDLWIRC